MPERCGSNGRGKKVSLTDPFQIPNHTGGDDLFLYGDHVGGTSDLSAVFSELYGADDPGKFRVLYDPAGGAGERGYRFLHQLYGKHHGDCYEQSGTLRLSF